ncbi:lysophospholipase I [Strigomonas culicis]|nr:lysophospholipase I [Strigomonas culicis]|eukprot:EPY35102.1 lysophospholipase I [Strigomonas culicis]
MAMPAWYDIRSMLSIGLRSGEQDSASLFQSVDYVRSMAHVAAKRYKINPRRVVYAGFSQGAATSIATALTAHLAPAGAAIMSGYFAGLDDTLPKVVNRDVPFHFFHGSADNVVPLQACKDSIEALAKDAKVTVPVAFKEYPGMMHAACPQEVNDLEAFLRKVLPEKQSGL